MVNNSNIVNAMVMFRMLSVESKLHLPRLKFCILSLKNSAHRQRKMYRC